MPIGSTSFFPSGQFAITRSYVKRLFITKILEPMVQTGPHFIFTVAVFPGFHSHVVVDPDFWTWSSNHWTLDHIVTDNYTVRDSDGAVFPANMFLAYHPPIDSDGSWITIDVNGNGAPYLNGDLPPRDRPYWLPTS
jgi:hypothetical protein